MAQDYEPTEDDYRTMIKDQPAENSGENRALIMAQLRAAEETIKKPFLKIAQLRKGESIEVKMVGPRYGKPDTPTFGKPKDQMSQEQLKELQTYYMYDMKVLKSTSELIDVNIVYEYSCPRTYYKDAIRETDTGEKKTIKGLRSMFMEGHRTFRIARKHEGKSTQIRSYEFTAIDKADPSLTFS